MNTTYLLGILSILLSLLYLFSWMLSALGIITRTIHRKIWNTVLLLTFLVTAFLGLLLTIQLNYKLEWPLVKAILKWHVNAGIALSFIGIFHLLWNRHYYLNLFKSSEKNLIEKTTVEIQAQENSSKIRLLICLSGFLSTSIQILFIREIATVFQGNEIMMSWTLAIWMLLTAGGAFFGRSAMVQNKTGRLPGKVLMLLAAFPLALIPLLEILKNTVFLPGTMVGPGYFLLALIILLAPVCLLTGFAFALLVKIYKPTEHGFSKVYTLESLGSLAGGLLVSLVFIHWFSIINSLLILSCLTAAIIGFSSAKINYSLVLIALSILILFFFYSPDKKLKSFLFLNQNIVESIESFYGSITITESAGQYNFYGNGSLLYTTDNTILNEECIHFAMMQRVSPVNVLLISGGLGGLIPEIIKYPTVKNVDYVELNPEMIALDQKYENPPFTNKLHIHSEDGRRYIQSSNQKYNVVIFALPDPASLQINRYYTNDFILLLKPKLQKGAVILYCLSSSNDYMSKEKSLIEACIFQTLSNNFHFVEIIPGEKDYFLASDSSIRVDMAKLSASININTRYVNPYFIDDLSIQQRGVSIKNIISNKMLLNLDEKQLPVFYTSLHFISAFSNRGWLWIIIPILLLFWPLLLMRPLPSAIYFSGFTASAFEILLIFAFQTFYGFVYSAIGIIIALFMAGLALGAEIASRLNAGKKHFISALLLLSLYVIVFPLFWKLQKDTAGYLGLVFFFFFTLILSAITGFLYVAGTNLMPGNYLRTAPLLYALDLIGSALGAISISVILLPFLGVNLSCLLIGVCSLLIVFFNLTKTR